jgi:formylglycine-generating enzyme required for sulfatase activity/serine/threonine protein kinase
MEPTASVHPADETLVSFGLGKLDDTRIEAVSKHLEQCDPCRRRVAELSSDSFVGRLREAQPPPGDAPPRAKTIVEPDPPRPSLVAGKKTADAVPPKANRTLPLELANHPQYDVLRELGRGGMGVVYLARNKLMDRLEVLKVLNKDMLAKQGTGDRFLREIQSAARLHHPNVVAAYTALQIGDLLVFAMEYVEGEDLAKLVRARGPLPVLNACYFAYQAAQGLQHAHECGMIHRDIKPGNLILFRQGKKGIVKILDFGLAKVTSEQRLDRTLTQEGQMLGTPDYIAPEQTLDAQKADIRADVYSLGCTLYHLLSGSPPFRGNSLYEVLQAHHSVDARTLNLVRPEVPTELAAVVAKMMAKEPDRRYQTPAEVVQALKPFLKPGGLNSSQPELSQVPSQISRSVANSGSAPTPSDDDPSPSLAPMAAIQPAERWKSLIEMVQVDPSSAAKSAIRKRPRRQPPWLWPSVAVGALFFGLITAWACGAFSVNTKDGVIVLPDLPRKAEVFVDGKIVRVQIPGDGGPAEITIPPGKHGVQVKKDGVVLFGEEVSLASGEKKPLTARFEPPPKTATTQVEQVPKNSRQADSATAATPKPPELLRAPFDRAAAEKAQQTWAAYLGSPDHMTNTAGMQMTLIPPGRFDMGSAETPEELRQAFPAEAAAKRADLEPLGERPVHRVTISKPFYLGTYEVTKRQFRQFVDDTGYRTDAERDGKGGRGYTENEIWLSTNLDPKFTWRDWGTNQSDDTPVVNVSHNDATAFCLWLANKEGKAYRLPTEAEWEYACRAGTTGRYYSGDDPKQLTKIANIRDEILKAKFSGMPTAQAPVESSDGYAFPAPVGQFAPNPFGLYDMIGNVSELCADWYDELYYLRSPPLDPTGPPTGESRVVRGGAWITGTFLSRIAKRMERRPDDRGSIFGFRVASSAADDARDASANLAKQDPQPHRTRSSDVRSDGFVPLLNGKDLSGWHVESEGSWTVQDGILVAKGSRQIGKPLRLVADQKKFRNFKLSVRILNEDSEPLVAIIRFSSSDDHYDGYGIATVGGITSEGAALQRGSIYRAERFGFTDRIPWKASAQPTNVASGEWYTVEITAIGGRISTAVNGVLVAKYDDPSTPFVEGTIVLAGRSDAIAHIKEIKIKELPPDAQSDSRSTNAPGNPPGAATNKPFVPLFNGADLTGWTDESQGGAWAAEAGTIVARGERAERRPSYLLTDRDYENFVLRAEFICEKGSLGGIALRAVPGEIPGTPAINHPRIFLLNAPENLQANPENGMCRWILTDYPMRPDRPVVLKPDSSWNRLEIELDGPALRALINGAEVWNLSLRPDLVAPGDVVPCLRRNKGRIGLVQNVGTVTFRNIEVKELPATAAQSGSAASSSLPPEIAAVIEKARGRYNEVLDRAHQTLASRLDEQIRLARSPAQRRHGKPQALETLEREKEEFAKDGSVPWSDPMRPGLTEYVQEVQEATDGLQRSYRQAIERAIANHDVKAVAELRAEKRVTTSPRVLAKWQRTDPPWKPVLFANGRIDDPEGNATWSIVGKNIVLNIPNPGSPTGLYLDRWTFSEDGKSITAENQFGGKYEATRIK